MYLKEVTERKEDGTTDTFAYLMEEIKDAIDGEAESKPIYKLGSLGNGGMKKLIELSNSVNTFFLTSAIENQRDSISSSRIYAPIHLVEQLLEEMGSQFDLDEGNPHVKRIAALLPSLLAVMLDPDCRSETKLRKMQRQFYVPEGTALTHENIRALIHYFQGKGRTIDRISGENAEAARKTLTYKLLAWATADYGSWCDFSETDGLNVIVEMAIHVMQAAENRTGMEWENIREHLSELQIIKVERGADTIYLTTRPTSKQLSIYLRMGIESPPQVVVHRKQSITEEKSNAKIAEELEDTIFEHSF
jgi:hypothetical protein